MAKRKRKPAQQFDLDIVIPVYGRADLLRKCLDSLDTTGLHARIILVDDKGPQQQELDTVYQSLNGTSCIIRHAQNQGFAKTVNDGIAAGNAPLVLVLNTDVELQPGAIQAMIQAMDEKTGVVGPKLLFPLDSGDPHRPAGKVQHAGLGVNFQGQVIHLNIAWSADHPKVNEPKQLQAVTGACMLIRRQVFSDVMKFYRNGGDPTSGPFNEVYGRGTYEDVEFCLVARENGWRVMYEPQAVGYHHVGASALQDKIAYPTGRNENIFRARCGQVIAWDDWKYS